MTLILIVLLAGSLLLAVLGGFVVIQLKCKSLLRLSSIALLLIISCWACSKFTERWTYIHIQDNYSRRLYWYVQGLDGLALEGRTNEIHQACSNFMTLSILSSREEEVSNFNSLALETAELSEEPRTRQQISQADLTDDERHIYSLLYQVQGDVALSESFAREDGDAKVTLTLDTNKTKVPSLIVNLSSLAREQKDEGLSDGAIKAGFVFQ